MLMEIKLAIPVLRLRFDITGWDERQEAYEMFRALGRNPKIILMAGRSYLEYDAGAS